MVADRLGGSGSGGGVNMNAGGGGSLSGLEMTSRLCLGVSAEVALAGFSSSFLEDF